MDFSVKFLHICTQAPLNQLLNQFLTFGVSSDVVSLGTETANVWTQIQQALDQFYNLLWPIVTAMAGVGVATMIILEICKTFPYSGATPEKSHEKFFRDRIEEWIKDQIKIGLKKEFPFPPKDPDQGDYTSIAIKDLIRLSAGGEIRGFYSLTAKELIQQMKGITGLLVDYNQNFPVLFLCFAALAEKKDVTDIMVPQPPSQPLGPKKRVTHLINKSIDGLQFKLEREWEYWNKQRAFIINFLFVFFALVINSFINGGFLDFPTVLVYLSVAVLGGFIAPVAKDLVGLLTGLKNRPI